MHVEVEYDLRPYWIHTSYQRSAASRARSAATAA
jgi:hypothetical protein